MHFYTLLSIMGKKDKKVNQLVEPDRPLATVTTVIKKNKIFFVNDNNIKEEASKIESVTVYGWECIVEKDKNFAVGDKVVYVEIGSVFPENFTKTNFLFGKPLKTVRKLGTISQGLVFPLEWLHEERGTDISTLTEGQDVTEIIGLKKWVEVDELGQYVDTIKTFVSDGNKFLFPTNIVPKTNEDRIQSSPKLLNAITDKIICVTRKEDGTSATYVYNNSEFFVCTRNFKYITKTTDSQNHFVIEEKFKIKEKLESYGKNIALQGEIVGPSINKNRLNLPELDFRVFGVYDIDEKCYFSQSEMIALCSQLGLCTVPILYHEKPDDRFLSVKSLIEYANSIKYYDNYPAEGIVVRLDSRFPRVSFKVISNEYLLQHKL